MLQCQCEAGLSIFIRFIIQQNNLAKRQRLGMTYERIGIQSRSEISQLYWRRLSLALPLVLLISMPAVLATRLILNATYPDRFDHTIPSISKTAAYAPGSYVFAIGMSAVAICIVISWWVFRRVGSERILHFAPRSYQYRLLGLNSAGSVLGMIAGLMLGLLAIISLEVHNDLHMILSALYFPFQILAFVVDSLCYVLLRRSVGRKVSRELNLAVMTRLCLCLAIMISAGLFLYMFMNKSGGLFGSRHLAQQVYIISEHAVAWLSLGYPAALYPDVLRHFQATSLRI